MAKKRASSVLNLVTWATGVLVSLSVGFAMIDGILRLPNYLGGSVGVDVFVGWIVVITTAVSAVLAILEK
jgi:hypothetical protein|tara:strand:- start:7805 stop:8014 length:210 start_codon:yes stop_codon:yes gene_type:complete